MGDEPVKGTMTRRRWSMVRSSPQRSGTWKVAPLAICWLCEALFCLLLCRCDSRLIDPSSDMSWPLTDWDSGADQTGPFSLRRFDPNEGHRPLVSISWDNLRAENGHFGIFGTPVHRTVVIEDLTAKLYQYASHEQGGGEPDSACRKGDESDLAAHLEALQREFGRNSRNLGFEYRLPVDAGHVTELVVRDFEYSRVEDGSVALGVRSGTATVSDRGLKVTLRGCVVVTAREGARLVSNFVLWDLERKTFSVPGTYALNYNGTLAKGRGILCDDRLRVSVPPAVSDARVTVVDQLLSDGMPHSGLGGLPVGFGGDLRRAAVLDE